MVSTRSRADAEAVAAGRELLAGAAVVIGCDAPDAPLPADWREAYGVATIHLATNTICSGI